MLPEHEQEIKDLKAKVKKLTEEHPNLGVFVVVDARDYQERHWVFCGNLCPACAIENALEWGLETGITHNQKLTSH